MSKLNKEIKEGIMQDLAYFISKSYSYKVIDNEYPKLIVALDDNINNETITFEINIKEVK